MSTAASPDVLAHTQARAGLASQVRAAGASVPWTIWAGVAAVTSANIGGAWDVSWHRTIGRDTFWTPAHMMVYLCGVLAGVVGLYLVAQSTFGRNAEARASSISVLGLRAPFGVFLAGWGGLAMLTSAPFDNWWHNAYGLDVQIVSPPHTVLILGVRAVAVGMLFLILAAMNRAAGAVAETGGALAQPANPVLFRRLQALFLYLGGLAVGGQMFFLQEFTWDVKLHSSTPYIAMAIGLPMIFATFFAASRFRWAATATALVYTIFLIGEILILPLFPAQPKLGPVFNPVTHFIPAKFPILLLAPALALDVLWQRTRRWKTWQIALVSGVLFTAVLVAVEWPFASFLLSKASQNRLFGTMYFDYDARPDNFDRMRQWFHPLSGLVLWKGFGFAALCGAASTWLGLAFGRWMRGVQR